MPRPNQGPKAQEPNVAIPLASSYQARNIAGADTVITNSIDQRKINCIYEPVVNGLTDNTTIYLAKRPGVSNAGASIGDSGQTAHLIEVAAGATSSALGNRWVFNTSGDDIRVSSAALTQVIATASGYKPVYVDKAIFQGSDTVVVQCRNAAGTQRVFYATAIGTWNEITDVDFVNLAHRGKMEFVPGRAFIMSGQRIYGCELDSISTWLATNFLTKQVTQDVGTGLAKLGRLIIAFGESSMEVFHDIGNPTGSPLEALPDKFQRVGLASTVVENYRSYYSTIGGQMFWVSSNPKGVYAYNGETVEKVSTLGIDKILADTQHYYVSTITFQGQKAVAIGLTDPSVSPQRALLYFPDWKDWFEWTSTVFTPITSPRLTTTFLGFIGGYQNIYDISENADNYQDSGQNYTMSVQFKIPSTGNGIKRMSMCGVIGDTARSASSLNVSWSNDDYQTFSTARAINMTTETKMLHLCGSYRNRIIKLEHTGNLDCRLEKFIARIE